jgi:hypothetical protein
MLYRDDYYEPDSERPGETDVLVRKNRHGALGEIVLAFDAPRVRFSAQAGVSTGAAVLESPLHGHPPSHRVTSGVIYGV